MLFSIYTRGEQSLILLLEFFFSFWNKIFINELEFILDMLIARWFQLTWKLKHSTIVACNTDNAGRLYFWLVLHTSGRSYMPRITTCKYSYSHLLAVHSNEIKTQCQRSLYNKVNVKINEVQDFAIKKNCVNNTGWSQDFILTLRIVLTREVTDLTGTKSNTLVVSQLKKVQYLTLPLWLALWSKVLFFREELTT